MYYGAAESETTCRSGTSGCDGYLDRLSVTKRDVPDADAVAMVLRNGTMHQAAYVMSSLIPSPEDDNAVFGERALTMMSAVLYGLVDLRDGGHIDLGVSTLRDYLPVERIENLAFDPRLRTETAKNSLMAYMRSLPNWKPPAERAGTTQQAISEYAAQQHSFVERYVMCVLSTL